MKFKLRIWGGGSTGSMKIVHETIIKHKYSYAVNRNADLSHSGRRAYVFNKMHYFKEGLDHNYMRFEIVPSLKDRNPRLNIEGHKGTGLISFGNPFSTSVEASYEAASSESPLSEGEEGFLEDKWYIYPNSQEGKVEKSHLIHEAAAPYLTTGDMVKIKSEFLAPDGLSPEDTEGYVYIQGGRRSGYVLAGRVLFVRKEETGNDPKRAKLYFYERQDNRLSKKESDAEGEGGVVGPVVNVYDSLSILPNVEKKGSRKLIIEKMQPPPELFRVTLDLAILAKAKPTFHDLYALLRVTTDKQNRRNTASNIIFGDGEGIGTVGHHFTESNRVWNNYYKYGSAMNVYGSGVVPALRMYVSANPIYESMRKFISSYMRFADRRELINYVIEGGKGVFYFKRYAWGLPTNAKATILRNMEPSIDPVGWFDSGHKGHAKFIPIKKYKKYRVVCKHGDGYSIVYDNKLYTNGATFTGGDKEYLDSVNNIDTTLEGAFEFDGINNGTSPTETNEWIMFMTSSHYHWSNSHIYKPSVYNDIMGFLNNRCHHRSKEYERGIGDQYDMIRTELCRVMPGPRSTPGPRLHIFLSKSSSNFTYVFNTNDPYQGNLGLYAEHSIPPYDYYRSCPPFTPQPYKVISTEIVNPMGTAGWNPTAVRINYQMPSYIIKVTLDRPLRGTGRLGVGRNGWRSVNRAKLQKEPYRTDENAVIEYLHHLAGGYHCKRNMIGDYGASSDVIEGVGYRPFGACYPRFYFLKLIPKVVAGAILSTEPYAQMDFYLRAMSAAFINPYATPIYRQTSALNWQFGELASRSVEEDPTLYEYIDPRNIQS